MMPQEYWDLIDKLYKSGNPDLIKLADKSIKENNEITKKALKQMDNSLFLFIFAFFIIIIYVFLS